MEVRKCTLEYLDRLALWSMQAEVDMREGSPWGGPRGEPGAPPGQAGHYGASAFRE